MDSTPAPDNSLGLDLTNLDIKDDQLSSSSPAEHAPNDAATNASDEKQEVDKDSGSKKEKKRYNNADRHLSGSNPRVRLLKSLYLNRRHI
jgi:hypothetical protein